MNFQVQIDAAIKEKRLYFVGDQLPPDWYAGFKQWLALAKAGNVKAQYNVGRCYQRGDGIDKHLEDAEVWFKKAIDGGDKRSLFNLYTLFIDPSFSGYDETKAKEFLKLSVVNDDDRALAEISNQNRIQHPVQNEFTSSDSSRRFGSPFEIQTDAPQIVETRTTVVDRRPPPTSGLAIVAFIFVFFFPPLALILGILARSQISNSKGQLGGIGLANAAIIIPCIFIFFALTIFTSIFSFLH
jgi:hypothetical protein